MNGDVVFEHDLVTLNCKGSTADAIECTVVRIMNVTWKYIHHRKVNSRTGKPTQTLRLELVTTERISRLR